MSKLGWHVAQVTTGLEIEFEKLVGGFCPKVKHRWFSRGKRREVIKAMYGGCVFVDLDITDPVAWQRVAAGKGFRRFMYGAPIKEDAIGRERARTDDEGIFVPPTSNNQPIFLIGQEVIVIDGLWKGATAVVESVSKKELKLGGLRGSMPILYIHPSLCEHTDSAHVVDGSVVARSLAPEHRHRKTRRSQRNKRFRRSDTYTLS